MRGKRTRGRRRIHMQHDFAKDDDCVAFKQAAGDRKRMSKTLL